MKKTFTLLMILALSLSVNLQAQRTPNKRQAFTYTRAPLKPFDSELKTYEVEIKITGVGAGENRADISRQMENAIKLHGYEKVEEDGDIRIVLSLEQSEIANIHERTKETKSKQGDTEVIVRKYYYDVEIRYPLHLGIFVGAGSVVDERYVNNSQDYVFASTPQSDTRAIRSTWWNSNKDSFIRNWKKSNLEASLNSAQRRIENLYAFTPTRVYQQVYTASKRRVDYSDLDKAQELALAAYSKINVSDGFHAEFTDTISQAIEIWKTALSQYDPDDRRARINSKVAAVIQRNIIIAYSWMADFDASYAHNAELASLDRASERWARHLEPQIKDRQARIGQMDEDFEFEELQEMEDDDDDDEED